ncbi:unnamed protein product [Schistocephalus solidus]|uniref:Universal stress protein A-like protein n=1 Tax=Schistocephalus solidus TaxID=70667 RepID=A0A183T549_SCHSO|nr:unnamed protein product [Schistocephalus solidus]
MRPMRFAAATTTARASGCFTILRLPLSTSAGMATAGASPLNSSPKESENGDYLSTAERKVLLSVDGSEDSARAFEWYTTNLLREKDGLILVHIVEPANAGVNYGLATKPAVLTEDFSKHITELVDKGKELGKKFLHQSKALGIRARFVLHIGAKPGEHICRLSKELAIDIIVMGSRGLGKLRRTFLGSVSDYVLHHASTPVIIIPPQKKDA